MRTPLGVSVSVALPIDLPSGFMKTAREVEGVEVGADVCRAATGAADNSGTLQSKSSRGMFMVTSWGSVERGPPRLCRPSRTSDSHDEIAMENRVRFLGFRFSERVCALAPLHVHTAAPVGGPCKHTRASPYRLNPSGQHEDVEAAGVSALLRSSFRCGRMYSRLIVPRHRLTPRWPVH